LDKRLRNFIGILVDKHRLKLLDEVIDGYRRLLDDRMGIVRAKVTAARPLNAAEQKELEIKLMERTGKQIRMEVAVDPSLIGGVVAQVGSTIYDGSVRTQLQAFKSRLVEET
jgi:F-type H+-transporting ATPase subunit delta